MGCSECSAAFVLKKRLNTHLIDVHNLNPWQCQECKQRFRLKADLLKHNESSCMGQEQGDGTTHFLQHHTTNDIEENEDECVVVSESLECDVCGKHLLTIETLKLHKLLHSNERPYKCTECESTFIVRARLNNHLLGVHGINPHQCDLCNQSFAKKRELKQHKASSHNKTTTQKRNVPRL